MIYVYIILSKFLVYHCDRHLQSCGFQTSKQAPSIDRYIYIKLFHTYTILSSYHNTLQNWDCLREEESETQTQTLSFELMCT